MDAPDDRRDVTRPTGPRRRPGLRTMLWRGVRRRCPWCGGRGAFFTSWFAKADACRTCGLRWRRGDVGFELGAAAVSAIIVLGPLVLAIGAVIAVTWPEVAVVPMLAVFVAGALVLPILLYPVSYTLWQGIDLMMRPVEEEHFDAGARGPDRTERAAPDSTSVDCDAG